ncbi:MAG: hypothetical protein IJB17_02500 [Oscillospiraceae bacterium]|nr:hypothetical protein [Oscillospiraceae bacterium]
MIKILIKVLSSNLVVLAMKLISGFVFPALMTTQSYADYQTFSLYLSYITILHLGFPTGMFVNYGGQPYDSLEKSRYKSEVAVLVGILCFFTVLFAGAWLFIRNEMLLYITLCIIPYCVVSAYQSLYQAWGEFGRFTRTHIFTAAVPLLGSTVLYFIFRRLEAAYYIYLFIGIHVLYTVAILLDACKRTRGVKSAPVFDEKNMQTLKLGFSICIGNYINVLFHSVGKQFVKSLFDTETFAVFSFGLSLQTLMTVFITSVAQPMYNFLASGKVKEEQHGLFKQGLLLFGACSGLAFHACRFVVAWLVPKYNASMEVTAIYFMAFPAMAVINCMYINLYKLTRQSKAYVRRLVTVLLLSVALNAVGVVLHKHMISVTVATVAVYYIWLFMDAKRFPSLKIGLRDGVFLIAYFGAYLLSMQIGNAILAALAYLVMLALMGWLIYRDTVKAAGATVLKKLRK